MDPETIRLPDVAIHLSYDADAPPPHPGSEWTRFVCLSDTHGRSFAVPPGDVLLHTGDLTASGRVSQIKKTMDWIAGLAHPVKILIAGNHDLTLDTAWYEKNWENFHWAQKEVCWLHRTELVVGADARRGRVAYLDNSSIEIRAKENGRVWKVYGIPTYSAPSRRTRTFCESRRACALSPPALTCVARLTHGPPHGVLDATIGGAHVGCADLAGRLHAVRPRLHVFGHIHEARGVEVRDWPHGGDTVGSQRTLHVNAATSPLGPKAGALRKRGLSVGAGGPGWQPIIVDVFDPAVEKGDSK
ncbi:Metallo-dependent phosphatase-like protein [Hysterangium stoloniferum]|nr:Metallo-dependent phosphatase-like protein [Hysterangium stoloniferum]